MTITRQERIKAFDDLYKNSKDVFTKLADSTPSHKRLAKLYNFNICPGGWDGGVDTKVIDVFYGNRPIDIRKKMGENFTVQEIVESESGATLRYFRMDNGYIICHLYPARSENQRPEEDFYLLGYIKNTKILNKKVKSHVTTLISYMDATSIFGEPNLYQKINVFLLHSFKDYVEDGVHKESRFKRSTKNLSKFVLTVGLSGFLIFAITRYINNDALMINYDQQVKSLNKLNEIHSELINIKKSQDESNVKISNLINETKKSNIHLNAISSDNHSINDSINIIKDDFTSEDVILIK